MRRDFLIAIILGLATIPFGAAMMVAPEYLHLKDTALALTFWGGASLSTLLIVVAVGAALRGDAHSPLKGHRRRMLAIVGMTICGFGFMACAIWFYVERPATRTPESQPPTVVLLSAGDQLQLHNKGEKDIYLWGTKLAALQPIIETERRIIAPGFYYLLASSMVEWVHHVIGQNGTELVPFKMYLEDTAGNLFVGNFNLLITAKEGLFSVHTQQLGVEKTNWRDSLHSETLEAGIKQIAPMIEALRQSQKALEESAQAKNVVTRVLAQYGQLESGIATHEQFTGKRDEKERLAAAEHIFKELQAVLTNVQSIQTTQGPSLRIKTGSNTFRVTFPVPMRIAPRLSFKDIPAGVTPTVIEHSNLGFTVVFVPPTIRVEQFGYTADAEL